jgi:hypothetical protein
MTNLSRQQTKPTTVQIGDRVRVKEYAGDSRPGGYVGLEGLITGMDQRHNLWVIIVLLDNDPSPFMQDLLGGLPCFEYELEKL